MVFGCNTYFPSGGLSDCRESFNTLEEAEQSNTWKQIVLGWEDVTIFDRIEGTVVKER